MEAFRDGGHSCTADFSQLESGPTQGKNHCNWLEHKKRGGGLDLNIAFFAQKKNGQGERHGDLAITLKKQKRKMGSC